MTTRVNKSTSFQAKKNNVPKSIVFLKTSTQSLENKIKTIPFALTSKNIWE